MSTTIRADISKRNEYWIPKERYYELKHFCMQYRSWKKSREDIFRKLNRSPSLSETKANSTVDSTWSAAESLLYFDRLIELIDKTAKDVSGDLSAYLILGVTVPRPYTYLYTKMMMPCSRTTYFNLYRRFFFVLDKRRG